MTPDSDNFYHIVFRVYPYQKEVTFYMAFHAILILPYKYMRFVFFGRMVPFANFSNTSYKAFIS